MEYFRHGKNIGAGSNWRFILEKTATPFIMFLGSHDYIDSNYVGTVLPALLEDTSVAAATGELCFDYGTREEQVRVFGDWQGGLHQDAYHRVHSFLFERAHLAWCVYGIFRTDLFRRYFTDDLPAYGVDIIFLTRILKSGRLTVMKGACFHAWMQDNATPKTEYLERVTAKKHSAQKRLELRNEFRVAQHDAIAEFFPAAGTWKKLALRYGSMIRFGTFRRPGPDPLFYLLYLPVKLARKLERITRRATGGG